MAGAGSALEAATNTTSAAGMVLRVIEAGGIALPTRSLRGLVMKRPSEDAAWTNNANSSAGAARRVIVAPMNALKKT
jgi:hypothetical protein